MCKNADDSFLSSLSRKRWRVIGFALGCGALLSTPWSVQAEYADAVLNDHAEAEGVRPVIYPHWFHRIRFRCKVCHLELGMKMGVGSNHINMAALMDGKFCGACHNGDIAWSLEFCDRCHSGLRGLKTGIRGGDKSSGPGDY